MPLTGRAREYCLSINLSSLRIVIHPARLELALEPKTVSAPATAKQGVTVQTLIEDTLDGGRDSRGRYQTTCEGKRWE